jgi:hypothetical protein
LDDCGSSSAVAARRSGSWTAAPRRHRRVRSLSVGIELVVGYVIRDNLILNVIMLIYPFEAIKAWQLGA